MKLNHKNINGIQNYNSSGEEVITVSINEQTAQRSIHILEQERMKQSSKRLNYTLGIFTASASVGLLAALLFMLNQIPKEVAVVVVEMAVRVAEVSRQHSEDNDER